MNRTFSLIAYFYLESRTVLALMGPSIHDMRRF